MTYLGGDAFHVESGNSNEVIRETRVTDIPTELREHIDGIKTIMEVTLTKEVDERTHTGIRRAMIDELILFEKGIK